MSYDVSEIKSPRLAGKLLRLVASLSERPVTGSPLKRKMLSDAGIFSFRRRLAAASLPVRPVLPGSSSGGDAGAVEEPPALEALLEPAAASTGDAGFAFESVADLARAYREGMTGPVEVAERVLQSYRIGEAEDPPLRALVAQNEADLLTQARASAERLAAGRPRSPLEGVPIAVKDELDQRGYPTTVGTCFLGEEPAGKDATTVARLRGMGALLIGKTNMHEIGIGVTGLNPHHGPARNPYDRSRATGGSSSGSAAAVAAGLCPAALGADGGGSIRIPASLCGLVGLKPTFGRVSEHGAAPLCWSVAHVGPLGATSADAAVVFAAIAGPDPEDPNSLGHPPVRLDRFREGGEDCPGLRVGVYEPWFEHAQPDVVAVCRQMLDRLGDAGAEIRAIEIPDLDLLRAVHLVTIVSEMAAAHDEYYAEHRADYGYDTRISLALARSLKATDYVHAQRHRAAICETFGRVLGEVDVIATPATGRTAPVLPADALKTGESNMETLSQIMRFAPAANVTGLPAISFPAGYDSQGLPIGFQVIGRPWDEDLLLRLARLAERWVPRRGPPLHRSLLA